MSSMKKKSQLFAMTGIDTKTFKAILPEPVLAKVFGVPT